ncbi:MAG: hypothetical protein SGJ11_16100, partial [Phycisphaerae bacterium]|nr:hypothetical protein [Phycisphaerae bacterium]
SVPVAKGTKPTLMGGNNTAGGSLGGASLNSMMGGGFGGGPSKSKAGGKQIDRPSTRPNSKQTGKSMGVPRRTAG